MADFDVFNGDADGICSLLQLRLSEPRSNADIVTGIKRDIALLDRVNAGAGDRVSVLDISMRNNAADLNRILKAGASVFYADHHNPGEQIVHERLEAHINLAPEICTAVIVNNILQGQFTAWAVVGAFGDNFPNMAARLANGLDLPLERLNRLGMLLNYNAYGASLDDLHFHPKDLYLKCGEYVSPVDFLSEQAVVYDQLNDGYETDILNAKAAKTLSETGRTLALILPDAASSRRVFGVYGNHLAQDYPDRAHAILTQKDDHYVVSVRAPQLRRDGADTLCLQFETGGGRAAAAGINRLDEQDVDRFIQAFTAQFE